VSDLADGRQPVRTAAAVTAALAQLEVDHEEREPGQFLVTLPGTRRLRTHCWLVVRQREYTPDAVRTIRD